MAGLGKLTLSEHLDALMVIAPSARQSVEAASLTWCAADAMGVSHYSMVLLIELRAEQHQIKQTMGWLEGLFHGELTNFAAIHYAFPVSFVVMSPTRYDALPDELGVQLDKAALSIQVSNPMRRVS
ncbi:bacterial proteasome activator family protein [Burkholderia thailandensis]|uniref:bacterial proteasome activator family protein n=1 Tax=Burkholderia thailandensis TaxID=57975 RepID=UPI001ED95ABE|nr:bacterial proteasome activator family protein [Burkholderia thailandensis]MCS6425372.1 bacterial proteasome activator family protein [Burkholderia thailandensis]MCS6453634.1 bacterial proteasome activator family protein [Burkholderia thailandensis]MCS6464662.1 bacterial proteasome activator family protein [Burkholderia thailandensis]MCS6482897.1 bacterial proteasome activator family protein [Burkholderia thailandensis]MCS6488899.1 bacterial proteasome activator family protein [Burkholderia 